MNFYFFDKYWIWEYDSANSRAQLRCIRACSISVRIPGWVGSSSQGQCIRNGGGQTTDDITYVDTHFIGGVIGKHSLSTPRVPRTVIMNYFPNEVFFVQLKITLAPLPSGCDSYIPPFNRTASITLLGYDTPIIISFLSDPFNSPDTQGVWVHDALKYSINKASNGKLGLVSNYFGKPSQGYATTGCGALRILASGYLVRTIPKFNASFKDIFDGLRDISNLALSFEKDSLGNDVVRIEPKDTFFDSSVPPSIAFACFDVADVKFSLASNKIIKLIDIGYSKWQTEYAQGINEFNANNQYESTNITQHKTNKKALSSMVAGSFSIEKQRRKQFEKGVDSPEDDNIYIFCVKDSASEVSPVFEQTNTEKSMNLRIAPERNLLHYRREIASGTVFGVGGFLRQKTRAAAQAPIDGINNFNLFDDCSLNPYYTFGNLSLLTPLNQNGYGYSSDFVDALYIPIYVDFDYPMSMGEFLALRSQTRKRISFTTCCEFLGNSDGTLTTYYGYIEEVKYKPNEGVAEFKLLLAP